MAAAAEEEGQADILDGVIGRQEVVGLEDIADVVAAEVCELSRAEAGEVDAGDGDLAAAGAVESADHVEEGPLTRARRPHDRDELAAADVEVDALERPEHLVAGDVALLDVFRADDRVCCHG